MKKYYKVVDSGDGSAWLMEKNKYYLKYKVGKETKPKIGYIYAFKSLKSAERYLRCS